MLGGANMGKLMKQAQSLQKKMAALQKDLADRVVEGAAGGGMVKVQINGVQEVIAVKIDPQVMDPDDTEMLEDMVSAAVSQAMKKSKELSEGETQKLYSDLGIPPGMM